jgi:protein-tyrosine phosphatase
LNGDALRKAKITHILTADANVIPRYPNEFKYHILPQKEVDGEDEHARFEEACNFIESARKTGSNSRVLVHCFMGKSKAPSFTASYLIKHLKM